MTWRLKTFFIITILYLLLSGFYFCSTATELDKKFRDETFLDSTNPSSISEKTTLKSINPSKGKSWGFITRIFSGTPKPTFSPIEKIHNKLWEFLQMLEKTPTSNKVVRKLEIWLDKVKSDKDRNFTILTSPLSVLLKKLRTCESGGELYLIEAYQKDYKTYASHIESNIPLLQSKRNLSVDILTSLDLIDLYKGVEKIITYHQIKKGKGTELEMKTRASSEKDTKTTLEDTGKAFELPELFLVPDPFIGKCMSKKKDYTMVLDISSKIYSAIIDFLPFFEMQFKILSNFPSFNFKNPSLAQALGLQAYLRSTIQSFTFLFKDIVYDLEKMIPLDLNPGNYDFESFIPKSKLGDGAYGIVGEAIFKSTGKMYAMKIVDKAKLLTYKITGEVQILARVFFPFIPRLVCFFETSKSFYIIMQYAKGIQLGEYLDIRSEGLPLDQIRFIAAEAILALEYLHQRGIMHRDFKDANMVLEESTGHTQLVDFGFAKYFRDRTKTICGTDLYLAPEIVKGARYTKKADIYAIGIVLYRMLTRSYPFTYSNNDQSKLWSAIVKGKYKYKASLIGEIYNDIKSLIAMLLQADPDKRPDFEDIKKHPFFHDLDWEKVLSKSIPAPTLRIFESSQEEQAVLDEYNHF